MSTVIDQPTTPEGRTRCLHDLLDGECAWCKGVDDDPFGVDGIL